MPFIARSIKRGYHECEKGCLQKWSGTVSEDGTETKPSKNRIQNYVHHFIGMIDDPEWTLVCDPEWEDSLISGDGWKDITRNARKNEDQNCKDDRREPGTEMSHEVKIDGGNAGRFRKRDGCRRSHKESSRSVPRPCRRQSRCSVQDRNPRL